MQDRVYMHLNDNFVELILLSFLFGPVSTNINYVIRYLLILKDMYLFSLYVGLMFMYFIVISIKAL